MNLLNNQLTGGLPPALSTLTNLTNVLLSGNRFTGEIPAEWGGMAALERLSLNGNQLTGGIPAELGNLENLDYLELSQNGLAGSLPAELGRLGKLKQLYLYANRLTGEIPLSWEHLDQLTHLYLYGGNRFTGCTPIDPEGLAATDLPRLGLPVCPDVFTRNPTPATTSVTLSGNTLTATFPADGFGQEANLHYRATVFRTHEGAESQVTDAGGATLAQEVSRSQPAASFNVSHVPLAQRSGTFFVKAVLCPQLPGAPLSLDTCGDYGAQGQTTVLPLLPPPPPQNVSVTALSGGVMRLNWTADANAPAYRYQYRFVDVVWQTREGRGIGPPILLGLGFPSCGEYQGYFWMGFRGSGVGYANAWSDWSTIARVNVTIPCAAGGAGGEVEPDGSQVRVLWERTE